MAEKAEEYLTPEFVDVDVRFSVEVQAKALSDLLLEVSKLCSDGGIIPLTQFVEIKATVHGKSSGYLTLHAYNGVISVHKRLYPVHVLQEGSVLVPSKKLVEILKLVKESDVRLDVSGVDLKVRSGSALWSLKVDANESIPSPSSPKGSVSFKLMSDEFIRALSAVLPAVSTTTARPALSQVSIEDGMVVACDGARVHRMSLEIPEGILFNIPLEAVTFIKNSVSPGEEIKVAYTESQVSVYTTNSIIRSQTLLTPFPDVSRLILRPALENQNTLRVEVKQLRDAIKKVRVSSDSASSAIWLSIYKSSENNWSLRIKSKNGTGSTATDSIPAEWDGGTRSLDICVNHNYLTDLISPLNEDDYAYIALGEDSKTSRKPLFVEDSSIGYTASLSQMTL